MYSFIGEIAAHLKICIVSLRKPALQEGYKKRLTMLRKFCRPGSRELKIIISSSMNSSYSPVIAELLCPLLLS
jgi:hypothetical protein